MMQIDNRMIAGWGEASLTLSLPFSDVRFNALSDRQSEQLRHTYAEFVVDPELASSDPTAISECDVYRLLQPLEMPTESITVNGQYTPIKVRDADGIDLTGLNFKARIHPQDCRKPSSLGVAEEMDLPLANVVENFLRVMASHRALEKGGVLLHSAGLVIDDRAYIFCGNSGAGKTTLTRKAHQFGAKILSDDINLLVPDREQQYSAHAVPFTGEFGRSLINSTNPNSYPVACIVLLEKGPGLESSKVKESVSVAGLLTGCPFVNTDANESSRLFDIVATLVNRIPILRLQSQLEDSMESILLSIRETMHRA